MERLTKQINFIKEIEKLKTIKRRNLTLDNGRPENSAEHSWHVALMAVLLSEYSDTVEIDVLKVVKMLLIHDLVEIDDGDTWLYDDIANINKYELEENCANRIFGILPDDQQDEFKNLWREFERGETKESIIAASLDALHPLLNHHATGGDLIKDERISVKKVYEKKKVINKGSKVLWEQAKKIIEDCKQMGIFTD